MAVWRKKPHWKQIDPWEKRDPEGHNNDGDNVESNDRGVHEGTFSRATQNSYLDGKGQMSPEAVGENGKATDTLLPSARAVSNAVMAQGTADIPNSFGVNEYFQFFGQILTHDMAEAATTTRDPPIVPLAGLPFPFARTNYEADANSVRQQINEETSFLDLSFVYGNTQELLDLTRAGADGQPQSAYLLLGADGLLPTLAAVTADHYATANPTDEQFRTVLGTFRPDGFGGLPDPEDLDGLNPIDPNDDPTLANFGDIYFAGDNRVNQTPLLISQQTVWARNHNYWVDQLKAKHPEWSEDKLFDAARALNEAEWQHVVYEEYLTKLLGKHALDEYKGYKKNVDPSIINEWTTVAFRFGHDQSSQTQKPLNEDGTGANPGNQFNLFTLAEAFRAGADGARTAEDINALIRGQLAAYTQEIDGLVVDGNRNTLFGIPGPNGPVTVDLEVFDIERARDHGVGNYNKLREGLGLKTYESFDEYGAENSLDPARLAALKDVYGDDINKLDSIIGGLLERKYYDSQLGETFTLLTVMQFENVRDGDRLYYENRFKSEPDILNMIENTTLADILERNTSIEHMYRDAFAAHNRISDVDGDTKIDGSDKADLAIGKDVAETIKTLDGKDDIYAGGGNDYVYAGKGDDIVAGEEGNDWMWGGHGKDTFLVAQGSGSDKIMDFDTRSDKIDLSDYGFDSWRDVSRAIRKTSDGVVIQLDTDDSVALVGIKANQLSSKNFILDSNDPYTV